MQATKRWILFLAALLLVVPSCTSDGLDDGDAADVVLQVVALDNPPITATRSQNPTGTCQTSGQVCSSDADCDTATSEPCVFPLGSTCEFEVVQWSATFANLPKNAVAGGASKPFNDIILESVLISYAWIDCAACSTLDRLVGLGDVTVPAESTNSVAFEPIAFDDLQAGLPDIEGSSANLTLTFNARTTEGTAITQTALRQLAVETCN